MTKKKNKIEIPDRDFIEDCIWMSYRYCIGRHTIAAAMHAPAIAKFLEMNPDVISKERKEFMAKDIRQEITDVLRWRDDVHVDGFVRERAGSDAASLILRHVVNMKLDMTRDWVFEVDMEMDNVVSHPADKKPVTNILNDISDLLPWIKLADWLDPREEITYKYEGETHTEPGFTFYTVGRDVWPHKVTCNGYIRNPYIDTYIDPNIIL